MNFFRAGSVLLLMLIAAIVCLADSKEESSKIFQPPQGMTYVPGGSVRITLDDEIIEVMVDPFFLDRTEVTNQAYAKCFDAGQCKKYHQGKNDNLDHPDLPVVDITSLDAENYCKWVGKSLPSAAQWILAAKGQAERRRYPWGNEDPLGRANYVNAPPIKTKERTWRFLAPPCQHQGGNGPFGNCDLSGNAAEWVRSKGSETPTPFSTKAFRIKGGSYLSEAPALQIDTFQNPDHLLEHSFEIGFRCAGVAP